MGRTIIRALGATLALAGLALPARAQADDGALKAQIQEIIRGKRIYSRETSPPEAQQPRAVEGRVLHPTTNETLQVVVLRGPVSESSLRVVALVSQADHAFWTFAWRRGEAPVRVVNGPYGLRPAKAVDRATVENLLRGLIPPDGDVGFFDGMFDKLSAMGRGTVPQLVAIARDGALDFTLRNLAIEALGECATAADLDAIRELADDQQLGGLAQAAIYVLARLGDRTKIDEQIAQYRTAIQRIKRVNPRHPQLGRALSELAIRYLRVDDYDSAIQTYKDAIRSDAGNRGLNYYNLACAYSLNGDVNAGLTALEQAIKEGYKGFEWMKRDGDLKNLRKDPRFRKLLQGRKKKEY